MPSIVRYRLDLIPELPERIWAALIENRGFSWGVPEDRAKLAELIGRDEANRVCDITDSALRNIELRRVLCIPLKSESYEIRLAAMNWVMRDWGGIVKMGEEHHEWPRQFQNYQEEVLTKFIESTYQKRISSWSKVLAFADSENHAIYDARVAMSLNAILDTTNYPNRFYMPSTRIVGFNKTFLDMRNRAKVRNSGRNPKYLGYFDYLDLINAIVKRTQANNILEVEMRLFADSENHARDYISRYNLPIQLAKPKKRK